jgi:Domain of unknown function (DUF1772)
MTDSVPPAIPRTLVAGAATTAAFAVGCLLTQVVTVPMWRRMDPEMFLRQFATTGPATGAVLAPMDIASVTLLGVATASAARRGAPGRMPLAAATGAMAGTVLLFPAYFARANAAFLRPGFPTDAVGTGLAAWNRWNWVRTGLALAATALSGAAVAASDRPRRSARPRRRRILSR